jgi:PIN domain nuclease of toxin-antitoxin system
VTLLLDTHFLLWILLDLPRLDAYPWLDRYRPWGVSPVSFLEIAFLAEVGRLEADVPGLTKRVGADVRFTVDEVPLVPLIQHAISLAWTRDPFDRLLAAHSAARRTPLCTVDRRMLAEHPWLVKELHQTSS